MRSELQAVYDQMTTAHWEMLNDPQGRQHTIGTFQDLRDWGLLTPFNRFRGETKYDLTPLGQELFGYYWKERHDTLAAESTPVRVYPSGTAPAMYEAAYHRYVADAAAEYKYIVVALDNRTAGREVASRLCDTRCYSLLTLNNCWVIVED